MPLTQFRAPQGETDNGDGAAPALPAEAASGGWRSALTLSLQSRTIRPLIAASFGLIMLIALGTTALVLDFRSRALADAERELTNTALILAEQSDRAFQALDVVEQSIIERVQAMGVIDDVRLMSTHDVHLMLKDKISGLSHVEAVALIDGNGKLVNTSRQWPLPSLNVADRDYFKALKENGGLSSFVSEPLLNRVTGTRTLFLARKIVGPDGRFMGLALGAIQLSYFETFFGTISLGRHAAISLLRNDGTLLAHHPRVEGNIGSRSIVGADALHGRVSATTRSVARNDSKERLGAHRRLSSYPLFVTVANDVDAVLAGWREVASTLLGAGTLVVLVICGIVFLVTRGVLRGIVKSRKILQDQKLQLDTALNNMSQGLLMCDQDGKVVLCNNRYMEIYRVPPEMVARGCTRGELIAHHYATGLLAGDPAQRIADSDRDGANGCTYDRVVETSDGRTISVINRSIEGGLRVSTHEDVTEFRSREASFRLLFEGNPLPMFVYELDGFSLLDVNDAAVKQLGYTREQLLSMKVSDIWPPSDRDPFAERARTWEEYHGEEGWRYRKADGSVFEAAVYARALAYQGRICRFVAVIDMTERRRAEAERDRNREFLDRVIENVPTTIFVKDARDLRYVLVNRATERMWGLSRTDIIGRTAGELFSKEAADFIAEHDRELLQTGSRLAVSEHPIHTPRNGVRLVTSNHLCIRDQHGEPQYLIGVLEDVTDRKAVEDQLRQAQKMEAVGNLTGGLAHDFNNLLTIIIGNLDLLQFDIVGNADAEEKLGVIMQASERGADLTRQMLAFSRRQSLQPKSVNVNGLIHNTTRLLKRALAETVTVDLQMGADLLNALVDESQLETALVNIAVNARDAMPRGGTLTIATRNAEISAAYAARHAGLAPGDYVTIEISDTGAGMSAPVLDRIFEPFFTTKPAGKGTGLGLSMVYGFMKQSGGHITAQSQVGEGATFRLFLPVAKVQQRAVPVQASSSATSTPETPARSSAGEVILAVDDNAEVRGTVVFQLKALGYEVREADNAHAALAILDAGEKIDLLFTDIVMPGGINGKELATKARLKRPDLKVLFTSGFPGTGMSNGAELEDSDVLLSKPYRRHDLAKAVRDMLAEQAA